MSFAALIHDITSQMPHGLGLNVLAPHAFAHSAVFSTQAYRRQGRPLYKSKTPLATMGSMVIYQLAGWQLDQGDADVLFELLRRVFAQGDGDAREARVLCNRLELLQALGRAKGGKSLKLLDESLHRLFMATYEFHVPGLFTGKSRLVLKVMRNEKDEKDRAPGAADYDILIDMELSKLFHYKRWVMLKKSERDQLQHDPLARGLHTYYSSHTKPFPLKPETLKTLTGRETMREDKWLIALEDALKTLKDATGWAVCELAKTGPLAGKVVVRKTKAKASKPAAKAASAPAPAAALVGAAATPSIDLGSLTRVQFLSIRPKQAEELMPPDVKEAWHSFVAENQAEVADPSALHHYALKHIEHLWRQAVAAREEAIARDSI